MSRDKITSSPVPSSGLSPGGRDFAAEIVDVIGKENLLDIKFLIEPSSATRDEILEVALKWVISAEKKRRDGTLSSITN
jgi:hypothetical protein